ncbi:S8 family serine peptidase [Nannocystis sp. SCPEA4]|uniref:S8 family serine peptidase n=1 Tax=Nannocystis sp. SCPEA4 TaxID=2996787 RepID=UPI00226DB589|nr:S8 family serine peptidase [Nannocystis sp. SCPEA4]MCY1056511.1 S8 family serine peptidase [Nannocystis sp. SCPEA4]
MRTNHTNSNLGPTALAHTTTGRRGFAGATAFACALLGACDGDLASVGPLVTDPVDPDAAALAAVGPDMAYATGFTACPEERQIAVVPPGDCVDRDGPKGTWKATQVFAEDTPPLAGAGAPPPPLAGYCQFTWDPDPPAEPPHLEYLTGLAEGGLASDCEVVWGQGDVLTEALAGDLRDAHLDHLDAPQFIAPGTRVPVTVAVIDSAPNAFVDARSDHGESVGQTIRSVACPEPGQCPALIRYDLALPRFGVHNVDWTRGGNYGSQRELAQAIFGSVRRWKNAGASGHLVLNISLGFEPKLFGGTSSVATMPAPARAVYHALQYAACENVLTIVAAGNATGDACQTGPMAPAIWANRPAPSSVACQSFGVANSTSSSAYPLLHAVSGIGRDNRPLQGTRPGGRPRLAAPAFLAVGGTDTDPTTPLTGTSLAAASVSGVAALAWSYEPGLTAGLLGERLYDEAVEILPETNAQFGSSDPIRRVTACSTLAACTGSACPTVACDAELPDLGALATTSLLAIKALRAAGSVDGISAQAVTSATDCTDVCGDPLDTFTEANGAATACDHDEVAGLHRYTSPQPEWPACPACFLSADASIAYLALGERFAGNTVDDVSLELESGAETQRFVLGPLSLATDRVTEVALPHDELLESPRRATLHITFANGSTQSNEIPIY